MKAIYTLLAVLTVTISSSVFAEKFIIINNTGAPVECQVSSGGRWVSFHNTIGTNQQSPLIDIKSSALDWIWWTDGRATYKAMLNNASLQKDKKNFFNINPNGQYMHNFGGFKAEGVALVHTPQGFVVQK